MKRASVSVVASLLLAAGVSFGVLVRRPWQRPPDANTATGINEPVAVDPGALPQLFQSDSPGFSIRYPSGWTADTAHRYQALGPGKDITGVSFTVPASLAEGTNVSAGSYLSVEAIFARYNLLDRLDTIRGTLVIVR